MTGLPLDAIVHDIDMLLDVCEQQRRYLHLAQLKPYLLDDYGVNQAIFILNRQLDDLAVYDNQLHRWLYDDRCTADQRAEVARLMDRMQALRVANAAVLDLAITLSDRTIEKVLAGNFSI